MGRKKYSKELKARISLDAIKGQKTIAELASEYGVHANQIRLWKKQLLDAAPTAFSNGKDKDAEQKEVERDQLYKKAHFNNINIYPLYHWKSKIISSHKSQ
jgi:transposase